MPKKWLWLVIPPLLVVCVLQFIEATKITAWTGSADLWLDFRVVEAKTEKMVPGAIISLFDTPAEGQLGAVKIRLTTDWDGEVSHMLADCRCGGNSSMWRETTSFLLLPQLVQVKAPGFAPSEYVDISLLPRREDFDFTRRPARCKITLEIRRQP